MVVITTPPCFPLTPHHFAEIGFLDKNNRFSNGISRTVVSSNLALVPRLSVQTRNRRKLWRRNYMPYGIYDIVVTAQTTLTQ